MEQPNQQPTESVQSSKNIWIIVITAIVTALIVGGGVYGWQRLSLKNTEQNLQQQISVLQNQISQLQQKNNQPNLTPKQDPPQKQIPSTSNCAEEGEKFSSVYKDEYPEHCCNGLTEWHSGMDTSISIGNECYDTMMESGYPVGTCINCGNGVCEDIEDVCNCSSDCNAENSQYVTVENFCSDYVGVKTGLTTMCKEDSFLPLCKLCEW